MLALRSIARRQAASRAASIYNIPVRNRGFFHVAEPTDEDHQFVVDAANNNSVFVFSKTNCGFCERVKDFLEQNEYPFDVAELDEMENGGGVHEALRQATGQAAVPNLFVGGKSVGCGDEVLQLARHGELHYMIECAVEASKPKESMLGGLSF